MLRRSELLGPAASAANPFKAAVAAKKRIRRKKK
jgi:hypothetical protein